LAGVNAETTGGVVFELGDGQRRGLREKEFPAAILKT